MLVLYVLIALVVFIDILLTCSIRVKIFFKNEFTLRVQYLFFSVQVIPEKEQAKKDKDDKEAQQGDEKNKSEALAKFKTLLRKEGVGGFFSFVLGSAQIVKESSINIVRHIIIQNLDIYFCAASEDAAQAAILFGKANAVIYGGIDVISSIIRVRKKRATVDVDYKVGEPKVVFSAALKIKAFFLLKEGIITAKRLLPYFKKYKKLKAGKDE